MVAQSRAGRGESGKVRLHLQEARSGVKLRTGCFEASSLRDVCRSGESDGQTEAQEDSKGDKRLQGQNEKNQNRRRARTVDKSPFAQDGIQGEVVLCQRQGDGVDGSPVVAVGKEEAEVAMEKK